MNAARNLSPHQEAATILVVEDDVLVRLVIAEYLRSEGFHVIEAQNGEEALSLLGSVEKVGLVITDIRMPGAVDGVTLAQCVKAEYRLPVILVSGYYGGAIPAGIADAIFPKPYDLQSVYSAAIELLKGSEP
ncbi:MAG: response regulator [Rhodomicrobium sp.]